MSEIGGKKKTGDGRLNQIPDLVIVIVYMNSKLKELNIIVTNGASAVV